MVIHMEIAKEIEQKLKKIVDYLKDEGCSKILLFGSFAEGTNQPHSDIDIAVCGIPGKVFFKAVAVLPYLVKHRIDLVDLDDLPPGYQKSIEQNGVILYAS